MLSEKQLDGLLAVFQGRMQDITADYLTRMGEHIKQIGTLHPSDVHRLTEMRRMRYNVAAIRRRIAEVAGISTKDLDKIFRQVAASNVRFAKAYYGSNQQALIRGSGRLEKLIKAQLRITAQTMRNLSNTTVVTDAYKKAIDRGISAVVSGVEDYGSATRRALAEAGRSGLRVTYESGHTRRIDTAVRQNVLDGVRRLNQDTIMQLGKEFGADGIEIDAHMLCAEDHLPYQGMQMSMEDFDDLQASLDRPFGEWNCRHTWHPIILGISRPAYDHNAIKEAHDWSTEKIQINGDTRTRYEWSQEMRRLETSVRQEKDTAIIAKAAGDTQLAAHCAQEIDRLQHVYDRVVSKSGLEEQYTRMNVQGYKG